jgi:hypothetical protein
VPGSTPASRADARRRPAEPRLDYLCALLHKIRVWQFTLKRYRIDAGWHNASLDNQGNYIRPLLLPQELSATPQPPEYTYLVPDFLMSILTEDSTKLPGWEIAMEEATCLIGATLPGTQAAAGSQPSPTVLRKRSAPQSGGTCRGDLSL